jgi:hypothetical protein
MDKNVGGIDRIARLVLGPVLVVVGAAALAGFGLSVGDTLGLGVAVLAVVVGTVFVVTGTVQRCPLNRILGMNTFRQSSSSESETSAHERAN